MRAGQLLDAPSTRREGLRETVRATLLQAGNAELSLQSSEALLGYDDCTDDDRLLRAEALVVGRRPREAFELAREAASDARGFAIAARAGLLSDHYAEAREFARRAAAETNDEGEKRSLDWLADYAGAVLGEVNDGPLGARWRDGRAVPSDATIIAILDYKSPELARASLNIGDWMQTLAALRHLARFDGIDWTFDDAAIGEVLTQLRRTWPRDQKLAASGRAHLAVIDRDFPQAATARFPGRRIWLFANGWYAHKVFGASRAWPSPLAIEPILTSVHMARTEDLTDDRLDWLAAHGPVGARDQATFALLRGAGIPSYFSGCMTTTLSTGTVGARSGRLDVEAGDGDHDERLTHHRPHLRSTGMAAALDEALRVLLRYATATAVRTSRLHAALPARAVGAAVSFEAPRASDPRFAGLTDLDDEQFQEVADRIAAGMREAVVGIFAGAEPAEVRRLAAGGAAVVHAASRYLAPAAAEAGIRADSVTVAIAFDEKYAEPARTMLMSLRRSTEAAIELVVMTRGLTEAAVRQIVAPAGIASLRVIDMAGRLEGVPVNLAEKTTISTMDRLFLPDLLPDRDRVVYLDVDLMLFDDVAVLAAYDPGEAGIAARFHCGERNLANAIEQHARSLDKDRASDLRDWVAERTSLAGTRFNAGVLVLSLDAMRRYGTAGKAIELVEQFALHDQDALNLASLGAATALPDRWNMLSGTDLIENPGIVHWVGARKPWLPGPVPRQAAWRAMEQAVQPAIDRAHWMKETSYPEGWAKRAEQIAPWLPREGRVADIGCGAPMALRRFLVPGVAYVPADLRAWTDEVTAIDLDEGGFPPGRFDAMAMLGVFEYLKKPGAVLLRARKAGDVLVTSYCHPRTGADPAARARRGWINAFSEDRWEELLGRFGWHITERAPFNETPEMRQIVYRCVSGERVPQPEIGPTATAVAAERLTYLRPAKLARLEAALARVAADGVAGDFVEIGIALGGSAIVIAEAALAQGRRFAGFDVFGMIPAPDAADTPDAHARYQVIASGTSQGIGGDAYYGYRDDLLEAVKAAFDRYNVPVDGERVALVKGLVQETFEATAPPAIAFAHIDCDWHDPVSFSLAAVAARLSPGGTMLIDDYHDYGGARIAVDAFLTDRPDYRFESGPNPMIVRRG